MIETDALVIGAGPVGLFQVFELGLLEMHAQVVDSLPHVGGQCAELYPDKPIYDIPGLPLCSGLELVERLQAQVRPFAPVFHFGQQVNALQRREDGRFDVQTSAGARFIARCVVLAAGVGAFQPRRLKVDGLSAFEGDQLRYAVSDADQFAGQHLVITGAGDTALEWALRFGYDDEQTPASVTLLHRRDHFQAQTDRIDALRAARDQGRVRFIAAQIIGPVVLQGRLTALQVNDSEGRTQALPADTLLAALGLAPKLGPIADWGLALERRQVVVDTERFETSVPGLFAVGDVNTYPGKRKLILCGFHEATLAAFAAAAYAFPERQVQLQYTTTSPRLHSLLGVATPSEPPSL